jgi:hypothetical protein
LTLKSGSDCLTLKSGSKDCLTLNMKDLQSLETSEFLANNTASQPRRLKLQQRCCEILQSCTVIFSLYIKRTQITKIGNGVLVDAIHAIERMYCHYVAH